MDKYERQRTSNGENTEYDEALRGHTVGMDPGTRNLCGWEHKESYEQYSVRD